MFSLTQWENITLNEIYHPIFQDNSRQFMNIMIIVSLFIYILTLYVVVTQSTPFMKTFKYSMILQISWNFMFVFFLFIYCPIFYFPLPIISYNTFFSIKIQYPFIQGNLVYFSIIGAGVAYGNTVLFRLLATLQKQIPFLHSFFNLACIYFSFLGVAFGLVLVPLWLMERDPIEMQELIQNAVPVFIEIYKYHPNTFGVIPDYNDGAILIFLGTLSSLVFIGLFGILIMHVAFLYQMKKIKKWVSQETFALHKMLHRAMVIQLSFTLVTVFLPVSLIAFPLLLQTKNGSWIANFGPPMGSLFMIFDALCLFYFVKPYREFFISQLPCLKFLMITKVQPMPSRTLN